MFKYRSNFRPLPQVSGPGGISKSTLDQAEFVQETAQLRPGDKLVLYSDGAEPFIGEFDDQKGFQFNGVFLELLNLPIQTMMEQFSDMVQGRSVSAAEVDDVTLLGLEVK